MKRWCSIVFLVWIVAFSACNRLVETRCATSLPTDMSPELSAIDSLMWQRPDSALTCLLPYFDTCCRDGVHTVSTTNDCHYANLLLAELLYKNDNSQLNRAELLRAVDYYDSLCCRDAARHVSTNAFLDARAHYINGVGYYERDSVVEACQEYLKALVVMEERFEEEELVGNKARFMTFTYNRLGDLFSSLYMMEPAIDCYKHSYDYSVISPISSYSVSSALYRIGKQFDKKGEIDSANYYYSLALANMPDTTNLYYRDIVSTKTLLSYQLTHQAETAIRCLKQLAVLATDDDERLTRYVVIGGIYFEEQLYDSACHYLEPILGNKRNQFLQMKVANYMRIIYDSIGNSEKSEECMHYLALHNEMGAKNNALVSQLSDMYKAYQSRKNEKEAEKKRETAVKKTLGFGIPVAIVLALTIIVTLKLRSKKLLKKQREEADKKLGETEQQYKEKLRQKQQIHRMEQAAMSGRLKQRNEEMRELKDQVKRQDELDATPKQAESFIDEPICRLILERVKKGKFKSKVDYLEYKDFALSKQQLFDLRVAADQHFDLFSIRLKNAYPQLTNGDLDYCCLYLLGLTNADLAALMQRAYNTIVERDGKLKKIFGYDNPLPITLKRLAKNQLSI